MPILGLTENELNERFWKRVAKTECCWLWLGYKRPNGYGQIRIHGRLHQAHRIAYAIANGGKIPNLHVCHSCDNPSCVNPDHLWLGTDKQNLDDMRAKGRQCEDGLYHFKGENNTFAKHTDRKVLMAKVLLMHGFKSIEIAKALDMHKSTVAHIKNGRQWSHLEVA